MTRLSAWKKVSGVLVLCVAAIVAPAQVFNSLFDFNLTDGAYPDLMSLVQGTAGNLYGTASGGGANNHGTVFKITQDGTLTTLYTFCGMPNCPDGENPNAGLVLATDGNFYGTTTLGGTHGGGTVFRMTREGVLTTIYNFCAQQQVYCNDGQAPQAALVQAKDGTLYGTTTEGGQPSSFQCLTTGGCGTVFKITSTGMLTTLYSFCVQANCTDGGLPYGALIQAVDGNFYGTTFGGGTNGNGTVFKISPGGKLTTLHRFAGYPTDGRYPTAALVQASNGNFYGAAQGGGTAGDYGTVFEMNRGGALTTLHSFNGSDGAAPSAALVQATDGNLYGITNSYGSNLNCNGSGCGTVFKMRPGGAFTTLHFFTLDDGSNPTGGLVQATNGILYGTTTYGGTYDGGTVFSLSMGLGPFVAFVRPYGKVGQTGGILGQGFTGASSVSLNGIPAGFSVVSDTFIKATVPPGATSGFVTVVTPSGTLTSNVPFRVTQ